MSNKSLFHNEKMANFNAILKILKKFSNFRKNFEKNPNSNIPPK